jgi:hypothetical protein
VVLSSSESSSLTLICTPTLRGDVGSIIASVESAPCASFNFLSFFFFLLFFFCHFFLRYWGRAMNTKPLR